MLTKRRLSATIVLGAYLFSACFAALFHTRGLAELLEWTGAASLVSSYGSDSAARGDHGGDAGHHLCPACQFAAAAAEDGPRGPWLATDTGGVLPCWSEALPVQAAVCVGHAPRAPPGLAFS
jgi:hypothetical protein